MEAYLWWVQKLLYIALFVLLTLMVRDAYRRGDMWKATAHVLLKLNCVERELREGINPHAHLLGKIVEARSTRLPTGSPWWPSAGRAPFASGTRTTSTAAAGGSRSSSSHIG